jgi:transaldolase/glucose-6-phosphate isomerase
MEGYPLLQIKTLGQSIWLDFLRRGMLISGELQRLIKEDGLRGITSNPAIFEKVIDGSSDYQATIKSLALEGKNTDEIYQTLTIEDVRQASDLFRKVYADTDGVDGFVSLEVSPHLARDTKGTIEEGRKLWQALDRPNVLIKVPATLEGLPAITQLISEGVNVNVTLLFGLERYRSVAGAYLDGLEKLLESGQPISGVTSVASFFLSRIDVMVDPMLEKIAELRGEDSAMATGLTGEVAVASAKIAYQIYKDVFSTDRFRKLAQQGAHPQRLLWASTSTKNPQYSDVKYVEALIGPETVNTVPLETLNAFRDHGRPEARLEDDLDRYSDVPEKLKTLGIDLDDVTKKLEEEGIEKFNRPFDNLMKSLAKVRKEASTEKIDPQRFRIGKHQATINEQLADLEKSSFVSRLWMKDPTLWKDDAESGKVIKNALGWLHSVEKMLPAARRLEEFTSEVRTAGFERVVHMGMGGSSLAPLVFARSFEPGEQGLPLTVLDTTDPTTIMRIEKEVDVEKTLFIVASKSGTTSEPLAFGEYFYDKVKKIKGEAAGENFVVITDPETPLVRLAKERHFRARFLNFVDIGGRYSALSYFGMLPVALMGLPVEQLLERALRVRHASTSLLDLKKNPGVSLGAVIGDLAVHGVDKLTFLVPSAVSTLGMWLEQLLAESTGKEGRGILPVALEPHANPSAYGDDRVFVHYVLEDAPDKGLQQFADKLVKAGHPVIDIRMRDHFDLAQEFLRWEIATATAGSILGINAFNQPNVQESKDNTKRLLRQVEDEGKLDEGRPVMAAKSLEYFTTLDADEDSELINEFLSQAKSGDYVALLAYVTEDPKVDKELESLRSLLRDQLRLASTFGYGPRYLHSTGQYHKGGPNTGMFLLLTADDPKDVPIPGKPYTFGTLKKAQALGDLEALRKHGRRVIRIHLGSDVLKGVKELAKSVEQAFAVGQR